jgi:hypothetical protein
VRVRFVFEVRADESKAPGGTSPSSSMMYDSAMARIARRTRASASEARTPGSTSGSPMSAHSWPATSSESLVSRIDAISRA